MADISKQIDRAKADIVRITSDLNGNGHDENIRAHLFKIADEMDRESAKMKSLAHSLDNITKQYIRAEYSWMYINTLQELDCKEK